MSRKERKSKGTLSILDEFTSETGVGEIVYAPKANPELLEKIERATRLADVPVSSRSIEVKIEANVDVAASPSNADAGIPLKDQLSVKPKRLSESPPKPLAMREQTVSNASPKPLATREQSVSKALAENSLEEESVSNASPKPLATREQSVSKALAETDVLGLIGKEKKLLFFIFQKCESVGSLETQIVTTEELLKSLDVSSVRLRNLIFRLQEEKRLIKVTQVHLGRSGWRKFSLDKEVFQIIRIHLSSEKALAEREQSVSIASPKALAYPLAEAPYSSSNNLNINTNTIELPENLRRFGISTVNLEKLISSGKTTQDVAERSLAALSFDVENGKSGNLANILFGILGSGREYISQKYSEALQIELDQELARIKQAEEAEKKLQEAKLQMKFKEYLGQNPDFLDSVQKRHEIFVNNPSVLEKVAFEEFKEKGLGNV